MKYLNQGGHEFAHAIVLKNHGNAVPLVPGQPAVKQVEIIPDPESASVGLQTTVPQQYQVELDWLDYYNRTAAQTFGWSTTYYPAVFLVQLRLFHDPSASVDFFEHANPTSLEPSSIADRLFGEWRNLVWTTKLGAVLSDLTPGTWYQFRLLALSSEGHGGWGQPSWPIRVRTRPEPPMSPRNLTEAKTRIFENNVDVTINWQSPKMVTHPLKKYQDKTTYTIQNLKPATSYKIEVKAVSVFEGKELKSHPISLYLNTIPIPSKQSENDHSFNVNDTCSCRDKTHPEITVLRIYHENQQLKATIRVNLESETQRRKQYVVDWVPRVCIESQSNAAQDDYVPQRQTVRGSELSMVTLDNLRFQCHYKVIIKPTSDRKESNSHREWFTCFCTPSCQSVFLNSNTPPPNCSILSISETLQPMQLTYTVFPESQTATESARNSLIKTDSQQISSAKTYNAVLKWAPLPVAVDVESKRSFRALNNVRTSKHTSASSIRGVRVTWGPRIYEPVALEAYQNGLFPHLDPESAQSKVVDPKSSTFILKGLERETLYIVQVQPIGDHSDGPTSTIFFAIPSTAESNAPTSTNCPVFWIAVFCVVMTSYLNFL
ncbi:hypothetical protein FGIG_03794 [Fasciola gigantica]|uniref:Fibronectin type-III domain-containing protein n=1 Tax=Fasciola gigantica TaxID=46835 RepID=A0A504YW77_FASGI|nr:hypothetical protein FGIG_03794 [Fasciola gigantica]